MRYNLEGYALESHTGERYLREQAHNQWHDSIEAALSYYMKKRHLALLTVYLGHLHDDNIHPDHVLEYL